MVKSITLANGSFWKTQTAAQTHFRDMLARYEDNEVVDVLEDHDDLVALLERYDQIYIDDASKTGCGLDHFEIRLNRGQGYTSRGFWAVRTDGSETDFSFVSAVKGVPKTVAQQYYDACRNAVGRDLKVKKQDLFERFADADGCRFCEFSGSKVTFSQAQLRHASPHFGTIVTYFKSLKGWSLNDISLLLTESQDAQLSTSFVDKEIAKEFQEHHHSIAVLCIVAKDSLKGIKKNSDPTLSNPITFR